MLHHLLKKKVKHNIRSKKKLTRRNTKLLLLGLEIGLHWWLLILLLWNLHLLLLLYISHFILLLLFRILENKLLKKNIFLGKNILYN